MPLRLGQEVSEAVPIDPQNLFAVRDKAAIITGAAGGIGTVLVAGFAALGARVLAVDIVDPRGLPAGVAFHRADLRDPVAVAGIAEAAAARLGAVDILINNAGLGEMVRAEEMALEVWNNTLATNLTGSFLLSQAVGRGMIARRSGKIINIGSRCGFMGMPFSAAYNASKAGIAAPSKSSGSETRPSGMVRANSLSSSGSASRWAFIGVRTTPGMMALTWMS